MSYHMPQVISYASGPLHITVHGVHSWSKTGLLGGVKKLQPFIQVEIHGQAERTNSVATGLHGTNYSFEKLLTLQLNNFADNNLVYIKLMEQGTFTNDEEARARVTVKDLLSKPRAQKFSLNLEDPDNMRAVGVIDISVSFDGKIQTPTITGAAPAPGYSASAPVTVYPSQSNNMTVAPPAYPAQSPQPAPVLISPVNQPNMGYPPSYSATVPTTQAPPVYVINQPAPPPVMVAPIPAPMPMPMPMPVPAPVKQPAPIYATKTYGSSNEDTVSFNDMPFLQQMQVDLNVCRIQEVKLWCKWFVSGIQLIYNINGARLDGPIHGKDFDKAKDCKVVSLHLNVPAGEYITHVEGRSGAVIDQLTLRTSFNQVLTTPGSTGGDPFKADFSGRVVSFQGGVGGDIHNLSVFYTTP